MMVIGEKSQNDSYELEKRIDGSKTFLSKADLINFLFK